MLYGLYCYRPCFMPDEPLEALANAWMILVIAQQNIIVMEMHQIHEYEYFVKRFGISGK